MQRFEWLLGPRPEHAPAKVSALNTVVYKVLQISRTEKIFNFHPAPTLPHLAYCIEALTGTDAPGGASPTNNGDGNLGPHG